MKKVKQTITPAIILMVLLMISQSGFGQITSIVSGNWSSTSTWSSGTVPTLNDDVIISSGNTVTIDASGQVAKSITVNGALTYSATTVSTLTVYGNVTVSASGSFTSPSSGTVVTHSLNIGGATAAGVGGNLVVDGIFNLNVFSTAGVAVNFYGTSNNTISGSGSTINFYSISVNKGTTNASILDVTSVITCADATSAAPSRLSVSVGTFKLSSASTMTPWYGTTQPTSPVNARLWLNNAGATLKSVGAGTAGGSAGTLSFGGMLQIDAGTLSHGNGASSISIFGNFSMGGASATLNVYGYFYSGSASTYTISAGNINIYPQVGPNFAPATYFSQGGLFQFGGTALNFTGGTLTIFDPTLAVSSGMYYAPISFYITGGTNNLTGSTIRFGDGITDLDGSVNGFSISAGSNVLGNVIVNNAPASTKTTRTVKLAANTTIGGNLTINAGTANQFLVNGYMLTTRGNIINSGTFTFDVVAPGNTTSGLTFSGTTQQTVSGTGTFSTNVNNLIINNTSGASPAVDLQIPLSVSNSITLTNGILGSTNSSVLTVGKTGYPTFNLTRSGGSLASVPTFALGGVTTFNATYTAPSPAAAVTTSVELPASQQITTFTVNNASGVSLDKAVSCTTLALTAGILTTSSTNSLTVTGPAVTNITGGSATAYVNGPLTRIIPNTASAANYKFPVGKTAYELFEYSSITTGGTGTATFTAEAFDAGLYAGTAGTGLSVINTNKYWALSAALGSVTISSSAIRLTDAGLTSTNKMGQSNSALGTYNSLGGTIGGSTTITSVNPVDYSAINTGTFFRVGQASAFAAGTYAIGPQVSYAGYAGTFTSMSNAVAAITAVPLPGHVIFEFQSDYNPSVEVATVSLTSSIASSATATITFRPAPDVTSVINLSRASTVLTNAGADYVIFDGRNGGTGTNKFLQFTNTTTAGSTITLSADAQYNQFLYCVLKGSTTTASTGILTLNAPVSGNNFYTVDNCVFDGSGLANNCIYTTGVSTDATITNNNFYDYRNGAALNLTGSATNDVIDNNSIYQTAAYNGFAGTTYGIYVGSGNNVRISNNNIGGSGPGITGTWTVSAISPAAYNFTGIYASVATTSKIFNNKIQNFDWKSTPATWTGINGSGTVNIGGDGANFVGSSTGNDNIKITYYNTNGAATVNGIVIGGTVTVSNNNIGSITTLLSGATGIGSSINGILNNASSAVITNNVIGSATTAQSINAANQSTVGNVQNIIGINCPSIGSVNISGNTIANLYNGMTFASASAGMIRGIRIPNTGSAITIASNNFFSYSTPQPMTGSISGGSSAHSIVAIDLNATNAPGTTVTGNNIYDLSNTSATGAVSVLGIYCQSGSNSVFEKNYIYGLSTVSATAVQTGINLNYGGPCTIRNNVIRLGFDNAGNSITSNAQINGIIKNSGNGFPCYVYFNTIYIGGSGVTSGPAATYCFNVTLHVTEDLRDNMFVNTRSGGGTNYAVRIPASGTPPSGLTMNYNNYFVSGTGSMIGYYNGNNIADLAAWKTAVGLDANSISVDPQFPSVTNQVPFNPAVAAGTPISGITTDFAGTTRNSITPTIGAYELGSVPINNNTINYTNGTQGSVCATAGSDENAVLTAPVGTVFIKVDFASYGNPSGTCPTFTLGSCNATTSQSVVEGYLLGNNTATIPATNAVFGDPCPGTFKSLAIAATYAQPVCSGSLPGTITGSIPTGGNGTYTYLWESSTTDALTGFSAAAGTNNTQDYTAGALAQTTWFRRTITSGTFSSTSPAVEIFITPGQPVSVSITASATNVDEGTPVTFTATPVNGGTSPSYQWKVNNVNSGTNNPVFTYVPVNNDVVTCVLTSNAICTTGSPATSNAITLTVISLISNNTLSFTSPTQGTVCATAAPDMMAVLTAPAGAVFVSVDFASYGNPAGTCPNFTLGSCNSASTKTVVEGLLLGNNSASIQASNNLFGDPCPGTFKSLYISATYAAPVCSGTAPGTITGSLPTGGSGNYTYLWESSTTDATNGFTAAPGTNTTQDYTPGTLTQTTWFRRTVTSGALSNTSPALMIVVTPNVPVSVSIVASATDVAGGTPVTFTATPANGGASPAYQWKVNNVNAGTNDALFTYVPVNGDVVTCELTSSVLCASGNPATSNQITITVTAPITNNTVDYVNGISGTVCATASADLFANLSAPAGTVFVKVNFASYGNPTGTCPSFVMGSCNAATTQSVVEGYLLGNNSASIQASNNIFGDPCPGTFKSLYVSATYAEPVCSGTLPGTITGSTPIGGNGTYNYLWEVSTTDGTTGFSPAPGTNNTKDYTPGALAQTSWFRRTVTSGTLSSTSAAVAINVTPSQQVSVSISASANNVMEGTPVTFTATPSNGGTAPAYQWKVNNVNAGTNSTLFTYVPLNGDVVTCELTSSVVCASGNPATSNSVIMSVSTQILGNTIDFVNGVSGTLCATVSSDMNADLAAPAGTVFVKVNFASYGNPTGTCPDFVLGSCNASGSQSVAEGYLLGVNAGSIPATNAVFGDPCPGTFKSLYVSASYAAPVCSGSLPGVITGSTPTGGNGTFTYLWESSSTGPASGFSAAPGTNNTKDYTPAALTQTTWFRRTITSGGFNSTSSVLEITVVNCAPAAPGALGLTAPKWIGGTNNLNPVNDLAGNQEVLSEKANATQNLDESDIEIYPVPNDGSFTVAITTKEEEKLDIVVMNGQGAVILQKKNVTVSNRTEIEFDMTSSPAGIYYLKFMNLKTQVIKKIILNK